MAPLVILGQRQRGESMGRKKRSRWLIAFVREGTEEKVVLRLALNIPHRPRASNTRFTHSVSLSGSNTFLSWKCRLRELDTRTAEELEW